MRAISVEKGLTCRKNTDLTDLEGVAVNDGYVTVIELKLISAFGRILAFELLALSIMCSPLLLYVLK